MLDGWHRGNGIVGSSFLHPYAHHKCYTYVMQWHNAYIMLRGCFSSQAQGTPLGSKKSWERRNTSRPWMKNWRNLQRNSNSATTGSSRKTTILNIPIKWSKNGSRRMILASWSGVEFWPESHSEFMAVLEGQNDGQETRQLGQAWVFYQWRMGQTLTGNV